MKIMSKCKECGSSHISWNTHINNSSDVQQGKLNTNDVECLFYLGCDECSETLQIITADKIASLLNGKL